ncbi:hypothetical protein, partial [Helicobacter rodentium]|uniref:hypothetical protein n=1 Tax=Helicobacter rodentium TaxID=59617 RepID=UPI00262D72B5
ASLAPKLAPILCPTHIIMPRIQSTLPPSIKNKVEEIFMGILCPILSAIRMFLVIVPPISRAYL